MDDIQQIPNPDPKVTCLCVNAVRYKNNRIGLTLPKSRYGVFPIPLGQFTSVTYTRRTVGKCLDKN